jgi:hypothetical protein
MKVILLFFSLVISFIFFGQTIKISGYAPGYISQNLEVYEIQDYFSMRENLISISEVKQDSTFSLEFQNVKTQKIILKIGKNKSFIYVQPDAEYKIYFPEKNNYDPYRPQGNKVEVSFIDLNEKDINYKILSFDKWVNNFLGTYFTKKNLVGLDFMYKLDTFKINVENAYKDDTSKFFKTFVKFSISSLDDIQYKGSRNRFEKYDFYIKKHPISYENDAYVAYISNYYENILNRLSIETRNRVYVGVLASSPTLIMRALGEEYTLENVRLREIIMIKTLAENFYTGEYPQNNLITIFDSLENHALFAANKIIAKNLYFRVTELVPGSKAPNFEIIENEVDTVNILSFQGKHLYIQFVDLDLPESLKEIELLKDIYSRYKDDIHVLTIIQDSENLSEKQQKIIHSIPWKKYVLSSKHDIFNSYKIEAFTNYVLIDAYGYLVSAPAIKPSPSGNYETIDKVFFEIRKVKRAEDK